MVGFAKTRTDYNPGDNHQERDALILEHLPQVKRTVQRIAAHLPASVDRDDLINAGIIGLIQSAERFDPTRENAFMTYAQIRIRGAVLSELRSRDYLSRPARKRFRELEETYCRLEQDNNGDVSEELLAEAMGLTLEEVYDIRSRACLSFIRMEDLGMLSKKEQASAFREIADIRAVDALENAQFKDIFNSLSQEIEKLPEKERMVISLYYADELTMKEIGKVLDITESRVSQIHAAVIIRLRRQLRLKGHIGDT
ncbi:MAG TPA: FliA/WhiG family RNA polymerase sigma factor [Desulfobacterales bacterium]|nr:MAG: FliA/WhiG family RNA polymerase sigma factor [Deltaproteobacteria bacterium]RLC16095.1 MAG: FliA/WhiG family RNA polymerase sigma factor [Deltaproteobacteria bacterium]HHC24960.1 FliA/WhiG family RNA polymerase sigma factor [Desulfobacterales bacterium]